MGAERGNTLENTNIVQVVAPKDITSAEILFNDASSGGTNGIATIDADDAVIVVNAGVFGGDGTLDVDLQESDTEDSSNATLVAGSEITQIVDAGNEEQLTKIYVSLRGLKKFVWVRHDKGGTGAAAFGITMVLGQLLKLPGQTADVTVLDS